MHVHGALSTKCLCVLAECITKWIQNLLMYKICIIIYAVKVLTSIANNHCTLCLQINIKCSTLYIALLNIIPFDDDNYVPCLINVRTGIIVSIYHLMYIKRVRYEKKMLVLYLPGDHWILFKSPEESIEIV